MKVDGFWFSVLTLSSVFLEAGLRLDSATVTPETLQKWNEYVNWADIRVSNQASRKDDLLTADCKPRDKQRLGSGAILAVRAPNGGMVPVPHGLVHHWIGTVFIPNADVASLLAVLQDYDSYRQIYGPAVASSKVLDQDSDTFTYELKFVEKGFGIKTGLWGRFRSRFVRLDETSGYSETETLDMAELDNAGTPDERRLSVAASHGYVENSYSILRYRQQDGGVYVELETLTLSRDIPASVRWLVGPIVQTFSREVMTDTLTRLRNKTVNDRSLASARRRQVQIILK